MNIISIDPSKKCTGIFAIVDSEGFSCSIEHGKKDKQEDVLQNIFYFFTKALEENKYHIGFIEGYWLENKKGFILEPEIVGVIKLVFAIAEVPLISVPIPTWKSIVKIDIDKKKLPCKYLSAVNFKYDRDFTIIDEADAFLIYIAANHIAKNTKVMSKGATKVREKIKEVFDSYKKNDLTF